MCTGAILGLAGTVPIYLFLPALVAAFAFVLVLLSGLLALWKRPGSRSVATAGLWFALLGGMASVGIIWFAGTPSSFSDLAVALGSVGVLGMSVSLTGAAIRRAPETAIAETPSVNRDYLGAILVLAGATLGLVGSAPSGFTVLPALLSLTSFVLVLLFGVLLFQKRSEDRLLAGAAIYFALVGGVANIVVPPSGLVLGAGGAPWLVAVGPIGMVAAVAGALIRLRRVPP